MKIFQRLASTIQARDNCIAQKNTVWLERHEENARKLVENTGPHGSGFDDGTAIDLQESKPDRIVIRTAFHHMNGDGFYTGWTEHTVIVRPSLAFGFVLTIGGRDKNDIKDYIGEAFEFWLNSEEPTAEKPETDPPDSEPDAWTVSTDCAADMSGAPFVVRDSRGFSVCYVTGCDDEATRKRAEMIAAAPDMFAALVDCAEIVEQQFSGSELSERVLEITRRLKS